MVSGDVFKVAILNKFCIKTTIGSIADILEEDTNQFVADGFLLIGNGKRSLLWCQIGEVLGILIHSFLTQFPITGLLLKMIFDGIKF